jgi:hypothetical protein
MPLTQNKHVLIGPPPLLYAAPRPCVRYPRNFQTWPGCRASRRSHLFHFLAPAGLGLSAAERESCTRARGWAKATRRARIVRAIANRVPMLLALTTLHLAVAAAADVPDGFGIPPPPPPDPCIWSPPGHPEIKYDLTPFESAGDVDVPGKNSEHFFVHVCGTTQRTCATTQVSDPAGINTWSSGGGQATCAAIGSFATGQWQLQVPGNPGGGAQLSYTGGDPSLNPQGQSVPRSATIVFKCGNSEMPYGVSAAEVPIHSLHYTIVISGVAACPIMPQPLSWGWWTIIFFGVFSTAYFGGGTYYNGKYTEAEGLNRVPQWQYWQQRASPAVLAFLACPDPFRERPSPRRARLLLCCLAGAAHASPLEGSAAPLLTPPSFLFVARLTPSQCPGWCTTGPSSSTRSLPSLGAMGGSISGSGTTALGPRSCASP